MTQGTGPGIIAATIFAFTVSLGNSLYPMALIYSTDQLPLTAGIVTTFIKGDVFQYGGIMAGAQMAAAPPAARVRDRRWRNAGPSCAGRSTL